MSVLLLSERMRSMINKKERLLLRELARQVDEIGRLRIMDERRELWRAHNDLEPTRPLIAVFPRAPGGNCCRRIPCSAKTRRPAASNGICAAASTTIQISETTR